MFDDRREEPTASTLSLTEWPIHVIDNVQMVEIALNVIKGGARTHRERNRESDLFRS